VSAIEIKTNVASTRNPKETRFFDELRNLPIALSNSDGQNDHEESREQRATHKNQKKDKNIELIEYQETEFIDHDYDEY